MSTPRIGELLVQNGLVTQEQIDRAIGQKRNYPNKTLGQMLREMGLVSKEDLDNILDLHRKREKLGEILIRNNIIDEAKLDHALAVSKKERARLGDTLIKLHYIEEQQLAHCIATQYDLPFVTLRNLHLDTSLAGCLNANFAQRHQIVPISRKENTVTMAMAFPLEKQLLRDIERAGKISVVSVISQVSDIVEAQQTLFATGAGQSREQRDLKAEHAGEPARERRSASRHVDETHSPETEQLIRQIIMVGVRARASDIHLEAVEGGLQVRYRVDGFLQTLATGLDLANLGGQVQALISKIKVLSELDIAERRRPQNGSFRMRVKDHETVRTVDFRVSTLATEFGEDLVIRVQDRGGLPLTLSVLGLPARQVDVIHDVLDTPSGLFLVTGPTGCGKSATLHAMLARVNQPGLKTMSVEDPIECVLKGVRQAEVNVAVGNSFARILNTFMHQDPDTIMIGEIRDAESAGLAVRAALTGHTMMTTLQTSDATSAVVRFLDMGVEPSYLASTLRLVLAQRLVRVNCLHCREFYTPDAALLAKFSLSAGSKPQCVRGKGCPLCNFTGFSGRRPISEIWIPSPEELLQIYRRPDNLALRQLVFIDGRRPTMLDDGLDMVRRGETSLEELLRIIPVSQLAEHRLRVAAASS